MRIFRRRRKRKTDLSAVGAVGEALSASSNDFFLWMALADLLDALDN